MNHIELFAGCGGLSLGLDSVGFELVFANELSPMASETFAYNFFNEFTSKTNEQVLHTKWLHSAFAKDQIEKRLRENPLEFPKLSEGNCDLISAEDVTDSLIVGSIVQLNEWLDKNSHIAGEIKSNFGKGGIDLISGGPPCQSFSMAGLRQLDNHRNMLPLEFAKFVNTVQPKLVLLENVTGILRAFKQNGKKLYAWFEVAKAFASIGYIPLCLHINAKYAGVAQNRPRFLMIGVRSDFFKKIEPTFNNFEVSLFSNSKEFFQKFTKNSELEYGSLDYFDIEKDQNTELFSKTFLSYLYSHKDNFSTVSHAIHDLKGSGLRKSNYVQNINELFGKGLKNKKLGNHDLRKNNTHVTQRFRLYQILNSVTTSTHKEVKALLKGEIDNISNQSSDELIKYDYLLGTEYVRFDVKSNLVQYLKTLHTKKQTQKALTADQPAPAALSIPDDACHYDHDTLRTLTVREMARIQSFPDHFVFRSKITTGGQMRKFEVPQYTQVGNAVPPLLARAIGLSLSNLLERVID